MRCLYFICVANFTVKSDSKQIVKDTVKIKNNRNSTRKECKRKGRRTNENMKLNSNKIVSQS